MGALLCVTCAVLAGVAAWIALPSRDGVSVLRRVHLLRLRCARLLGSLSTHALVTRALAWEPIRLAAEAFESRIVTHGAPMGRRVAAAWLLVCGAAGLLVVGVLARTPLASLVAAVACVIGLQAHAVSHHRRRKRALSEEMPGIFRTLATAMASGSTLVQAIDYVGLHERGVANEAFVRASLRLRCGWSVDAALDSLREELQAPGVGLMATALEISQRTGSPLRELFQRSALLVEQQGEFERLLAVKTAQVRLSVRIVCLLPPLMVCLLSLISPDYLEGLRMPSGMGCLCVASLMDAAAVLLIRKIMGAVL